MIQLPKKRGRTGTGAAHIDERAFLRGGLVIMGGVALLVFSMKVAPLLFNSYNFQPHGMCYLWQPNLVALQVTSDALIGLAYVSISATLAYLVYKTRHDIPFQWVFIAFGIFIIACAGTHFLEIWTLWNATYWLSGSMKLITAIASVATAIALPLLLPKVYAIVEVAKASNERKQQLESAHQELEILYARSKELDELKANFFANVSHELRTPLTLILGPVRNLLTEEQLTSKQERNLAIAERNALILLRYVNDLLDISKIEAGHMDITYGEIDLTRLLQECVTSFETLAQERQITVSVEGPTSLPAQGDAGKLQRIFLNLLSNAFRFTPTGGHVSCALYKAGERGIVTIQDNGPGVQPALRQVIFERFKQGMQRGTGTGLGLAIVKEFVELHAGTVKVSDAPDGGALFTIDLPLVAPGTATLQAPSSSSLISKQGASPFSIEHAAVKPRNLPMDIPALRERKDSDPLVLIIEDNPEITYLIADTLAPMYRIARAGNGKEGLEKALSLQPDLILCDIMMPVMSGDLFVSEVRAHPELALIPIIVLSARTDDKMPLQLLRAGAQDYLAKPFLPEELRVRAANLITLHQVRRVLQKEATQQNLNIAELAEEVTLRKRESEQMVLALQESETNFRELADSMPQVVWTAGPDGALDYYNQRWFEYTGMTYEETRGWGWGPVLHPDDYQKCIDIWHQALQTGRMYEIEYRFKRASDGTYRWHLGRAFPARDSSGKIYKWFGTGTDIDDRKRIEVAFRAMEERKDLFLSMASHELKTPLTSLKVFTHVMLKMLQHDERPEPVRYLTKMDTQINKLIKLIAELLDISRVQTGKLVLAEEDFDSDTFVQDVVDMTQQTSPTHPITIIDSMRQQLYGDKDRLGQVLINLLTNAIKFSPTAGPIEVLVTTDQKHVTFGVRDHGIGIPQDQQALIFERFYRVYGDRDTKYPGLGIGLYIAFEIVQRHGGRIWVESVEGRGSTFFFSIPLDRKTPATEAPTHIHQEGRAAS
ncbi:MAG: ATP-binding protein [Chloroflexota bacterium]|nr:ATP-binding protein [Chloroflexota bacterium]